MTPDLTPVYYVSGAMASIATVLAATRAYYSRQRKRWTDEGGAHARNAEAMEANTRAAVANTAAIGLLTQKLDRFADETRATLHSHDSRLGRLEDMAENQLGWQRRPRTDRRDP